MPRQILTVNVEDYFHVWALRGSDAVLRKHWDRLEPRLDTSLDAVLDLFSRYDAKATFFVFGCIADRQPELIDKIVSRGHEIASRGYCRVACPGSSEPSSPRISRVRKRPSKPPGRIAFVAIARRRGCRRSICGCSMC